MAEVPHLVKMHDQWGDAGLVVLGLTFADQDETSAFIAKRGVLWPVLSSAGDDFQSYGVRAVPATYLIDPQGRIVAEGLGPIRAVLEEQLGPAGG